MHRGIRYVLRNTENKSIRRQIRANKYRIYAGKTPHYKIGFFREEGLSLDATVRNLLADEAEIL